MNKWYIQPPIYERKWCRIQLMPAIQDKLKVKCILTRGNIPITFAPALFSNSLIYINKQYRKLGY